MSEVDIIKIVAHVILNIPLLMALVLYIDYKIDGDYDIEFEIEEYDEVFNMDKPIFKLVEKLHELINGNEENEEKG